MGILENATLVYIDAQGVSRKAIIKVIGKGAVSYVLKDGRKVTMQPKEDGSLEVLQITDGSEAASSSRA